MKSGEAIGAPEAAEDRKLRGRRLAELRAALSKSQDEMGAMTGVTGRSWQDYERGITQPKVSVYERLRMMGINPAWLLGDGAATMYLERGGLPAIGSADEEAAADFVALPRYGVSAAAGSGAVVGPEQVVDWIYFRRDWLHTELGVVAARAAVITAVGDSMSPTISDGDLLIVDLSEPRIRGDGIYVIGVDDEVWVKRVARRRDGGLVISSDNPKYAHTTEAIERADLRSLRLVGRVVWVGGRI